MRKTKLFLLTLFCSALLSGNIFAQAVGDYGSNVSGNWGTAANWIVCTTAGTWTGATTATSLPTASTTINFYIRNGNTMVVEASPKYCNNLIVENGGKLWCNSANTSPRYLRLAGTSIINNGEIGGATDALSLYMLATSLTITGSGVTSVGRVQAQGGAGSTVTFDANTTITYAGGSGTGGTGLYPITDNFTVNINAGKTLTMGNNSYLAVNTSSGSSAGTLNMTINVNGTLTGGGTNAIINLGTASGKTVNFNVGSTGVVTLASILRADYRNLGTVNVNVANGGVINSPSASSLLLSKGTVILDGILNCESASTDSLGTTTVTSTGILRLAKSAFPKGTKAGAAITLNSGSTVEYYGTSAYALPTTPTTYQNLKINNANGFSLGANTTVSGALTLTSGKLTLGDYNLTAGSTSGASASSYVVAEGAGVLTQNVPASTEVLFPVGGSSSYTPAKVKPATGSDFAVKMTTSPISAPGNVIFNPETWEITPTTASLTDLTLTVASPASTITKRIYHYNGTTYDAIPATLTGNDYSATVSSFSPFTTGGSTVATALENNTKNNVYFDGSVIHNPDRIKLQVYDLAGKMVEQSTSDINMNRSIKGVYILKGDNLVMKIKL